MKEQYGCSFLFVCSLYLTFAILAGGIATFIIQFVVFGLCDYCGASLGEYLFVLVLDIMFFVFIAFLMLWDRDFNGYGNHVLAFLALLIACIGGVVVGNSLYNDFAMMFPNARDFDKDAIEMGSFILWFQMTELSILIGLAVLSAGLLLSYHRKPLLTPP